MGIIIKPVVTEKMTALGEKLHRYGFIVKRDSNKLQIKKAVEELYGVDVREVKTINYGGKNKSRFTKAGVVKGTTGAYKKAIITLAEGETIDFYSNI